jgi:hypothetical protein
MSIHKVIICTPILIAVAMAASAQNYAAPDSAGTSQVSTPAPNSTVPYAGQKFASTVDQSAMSTAVLRGQNKTDPSIPLPDYISTPDNTTAPQMGSLCSASEIDWRFCEYSSDAPR